jgi:cation/acetate symporter
VGTIPAVAGMMVGIGFTTFYIIGYVFFGMPPWLFGINAQGIGAVGMALNFAVAILLTPFFPPPSEAVQRIVEDIREPEGVGPATVIEAAPEH